jgi:hypothetical protein
VEVCPQCEEQAQPESSALEPALRLFDEQQAKREADIAKKERADSKVAQQQETTESCDEGGCEDSSTKSG